MREAIVIENLTRYYDGFLALDNLSLKIKENENVALLGPNGAGNACMHWVQHVILEAEKNKDFKKKAKFLRLLKDL